MVCRTQSACVNGLSGQVVLLEASKQNSLPQILIAGLPDTIVQESRERIKASLNHLGFDVPTSKILIHLSPAETKKTGSHFDLPLALALLVAEGHFPPHRIAKTAFLGELSLSGEIKPVSHFVPLLEALISDSNIDSVVVPAAHFEETRLFPNHKVHHCRTLKEVIDWCFLSRPLPTISQRPTSHLKEATGFSLDSLVGMAHAKRVLVLSVAGQHPLLLEGPPGSGKTLLSHCAPQLLPNLNENEVREVSRIYSLFGESRIGNIRPPFRSPHHSISAAAFLGGGNRKVTPGELSLSHRGLLFLDELPEFRRDVIEGLREPLQSGEIHLHRISSSLKLPAAFHLIAAMNPCRCGYSQSTHRSCSCSSDSIRNYRKKISGPILDRFRLYLWIERQTHQRLEVGMTQEVAQSLISQVREETKLFHETQTWNDRKKRLTNPAEQFLSRLEEKQGLSFRRLENILRLALTISQIEQSNLIQRTHLEEAWSLQTPETLI